MSAYLIKKFHHVSHDRQASLRQQGLVPILDKYPDQSIDELKIKKPKQGDWLIEYYDENHPFYLMKVERYVCLPSKHLYVKHFMKIVHPFSVDISQASPLFRLDVVSKKHLSEFTEESVYSLLRYFENQIKIKEKEERGKATKKTSSKRRGRVFKPMLKYSTRWPKPAPLKKKEPGSSSVTNVKKIRKPNPSKDMDKLIRKIFAERYPGQQPVKGQMQKIRQEVLITQNKK